MSKIKKQQELVRLMIGIYCRGKHSCAKGQLCPKCQELNAYAHQRLKRCSYGENKTSCSECTTHCYHPQRRKDIVEVMRYSGKRMIFHSPRAALWHIIEKIKGKFN